MSDIVKRLRRHEKAMGFGGHPFDKLCKEAADEIERLRACLAESDEALWRVYEAIYGHRSAEGIDPWVTAVRGTIAVVKQRNELSKALSGLRKRVAVLETETIKSIRDMLDD